jgi:plasmid stabilization system protein ParE
MTAGPRIIRKPKARRDIVDIASFIALDSPLAAERFLEAVEVTFYALARVPEIPAPLAG